MNATLALALVVLFSLPAMRAADWPHYRGPALNGITTEKLPASLPAEPRQLWKRKVGTGVSAATVVGERVFTMGNDGNQDVVFALDAATGKEAWKHKFRLPVDAKNFEGGPRSTPTHDGGRLYTVSHSGDVWCLDAASGKPIWNKHLMQDFKGRRPNWGYSGSPTIDGGLVLLDAGGAGASTVALDEGTGALVWKSGDEEAGYGSVAVGTVAGRRTAVVFKAASVVGLDVKSGRRFWSAPWKTSYDVNAITPILSGDRVLVTSGYGTGATLLGVSGETAAPVWKSKELRSQFNSPVIWQGHIYGIDGNDGPRGQLVCLEFSTGRLLWKQPIGGGALICAAGQLIVLNEKGEVIVADASPTGFRQSARWQALGSRCWVQPTLAHGRLYVRNNTGDLACYEMKTP
jgi:outer membrane protein assembly factor BamB